VCDTNSGGVILPTTFFILLLHHSKPSFSIQTHLDFEPNPFHSALLNSPLSLSLSSPFSEFSYKYKKKALKIHPQPLCNGFTSFSLSELRFKGFSRLLGLKFLGNILLISSLPFYITLFMLFLLRLNHCKN